MQNKTFLTAFITITLSCASCVSSDKNIGSYEIRLEESMIRRGAKVYVIRKPRFSGFADKFLFSLLENNEKREVEVNYGNSFFSFYICPGNYTFLSENKTRLDQKLKDPPDTISLNAEAGKVYFIKQRYNFIFSWRGTSRVSFIDGGRAIKIMSKSSSRTFDREAKPIGQCWEK